MSRRSESSCAIAPGTAPLGERRRVKERCLCTRLAREVSRLAEGSDHRAFITEHGIIAYSVSAPGNCGCAIPPGFIAQYRQISFRQGAQLIKGLIARRCRCLLGNAGGLGPTLRRAVPARDLARAVAKLGLYRTRLESRVGVAVAVKLTHWLVWVDLYP